MMYYCHLLMVLLCYSSTILSDHLEDLCTGEPMDIVELSFTCSNEVAILSWKVTDDDDFTNLSVEVTCTNTTDNTSTSKMAINQSSHLKHSRDISEYLSFESDMVCTFESCLNGLRYPVMHDIVNTCEQINSDTSSPSLQLSTTPVTASIQPEPTAITSTLSSSATVIVVVTTLSSTSTLTQSVLSTGSYILPVETTVAADSPTPTDSTLPEIAISIAIGSVALIVVIGGIVLGITLMCHLRWRIFGKMWHERSMTFNFQDHIVLPETTSMYIKDIQQDNVSVITIIQPLYHGTQTIQLDTSPKDNSNAVVNDTHAEMDANLENMPVKIQLKPDDDANSCDISLCFDKDRNTSEVPKTHLLSPCDTAHASHPSLLSASDSGYIQVENMSNNSYLPVANCLNNENSSAFSCSNHDYDCSDLPKPKVALYIEGDGYIL